MTRYLLVSMAWLSLGTSPASQEGRPGSTPPVDGKKVQTFSGRVVDGLGRPVSGVKVTVEPYRDPGEEAPVTVLRTGDDGRYSGTLPPDHDARLTFEREGYIYLSASAASRDVILLKRKVAWNEASMLPYQDANKVEHGLREILASQEWEVQDEDTLGFLFRHQDRFRPALRRLVPAAHVGASARDWLDLLDDPGDRDLFPKGRRYAPKREIREADLVEALKATASERNFNSSRPEPSIKIDFIAFTDGLDRALIQCGINRAALTGITWQFVFRRVGKQWELRSAKEAGRS